MLNSRPCPTWTPPCGPSSSSWKCLHGSCQSCKWALKAPRNFRCCCSQGLSAARVDSRGCGDSSRDLET
ncbi:hypothetical protein Ae201684_015620 [Aphanomyces euteiches]|uniref:Uncharacterized protein n=1 Tax=Aphanomyces euteiches TaxID=100861 RepID=A0A6G0WFD3_9STRA|nr:hypothetical protein Ae201684_015620 [Aphanomyces euteiches]